jgi:hypothetical protein
MSDELRHEELRGRTQQLLQGGLKHVRTVALAAALIPLASVAISPAYGQCGSSGQPDCPPTQQVPEPSTLVLIGSGLAGAAIANRLRKK